MQALRSWSRGFAVACLCGTFAVAQEAPQKPVVVTVPSNAPQSGVVVVGQEGDVEIIQANPNASGVFVFSDSGIAGTVQAEAGKYWIGLLCIDAGDALRQQLGLEGGVGLLVDAVTDEAPAKKAGLQKNDLLIAVTLPSDDPKAESQPLTQVLQLVEAVQKSETKPLKFTLLRRGQKQSVEVTPAERPQVQFIPGRATLQLKQAGLEAQQQLQVQRKLAEDRAEQAAKEADRAREALKALDLKLHKQPLGIRTYGPMTVRRPEAPKLPEGMSMEFHQVVGQPEHVIVRKGDQKWEATTEQLDKLPTEVRGFVEQQLAFRRGMASGPQYIAFGAQAQPTMVAASPNYIRSRLVGANESMIARSLPDGTVVTIGRKPGEPALIKITKKDQPALEITEKELDKLPEDLRKLVAQLLAEPSANVTAVPVAPPGWGKSPMSGGFTPFVPQSPEQAEAMRRQMEMLQKGAASDAARQLHERQEAMLKQLQQLTEKVEKLQQALEKSASKP